MKKPQWITLSIALLLVISLFAATQQYFFGDRPLKISAKDVHTEGDGHNHGNEQAAISTDSIIYYAKQNLPPTQVAYLAQLENSILRGNVPEQKLHLMHQLARYWADSAGSVTPMAWYPYAWYTAEAARLENSENSLSFAAHKFLERLTVESTPQVKQWEALQAKDLFERSLKLNPLADSAKVGLGATILYGGLGTPMAGISLIREVVEKDSTNVFAQLTLGEASLVSGQLEKAIERFKTVVRLNPANLQAGLLLADSYEKMQKWTEAVQSYKRALPFVSNPAMKAAVEKRIIELRTK